MAEAGIRHLAIVEGGEVVGMLSVRDLLRYFKNWGASCDACSSFAATFEIRPALSAP